MSLQLPGGGTIRIGATSVSIPVLLRSTTDNTGVTGKIYSDITGSYWRQGGTRTAITMATLAAVDSAYSAGGFKEVDATNAPGLYRLDVPDAALAVGVDWVVIALKCTGTYGYFAAFSLTWDGVLRVFTPQAVAATSVTVDSGGSATASAYKGALFVVIASDVAADLGAVLYADAGYNGTSKVASSTAGWTRTPTGTVSAITVVALQGQAAGFDGAQVTSLGDGSTVGVNLKKVNSAAVTGDGSGTPWQAA